MRGTPSVFVGILMLLWAAPGGVVAGAPQGAVPPLRGLESLSPEDQARVRENRERWQRLPPQERQRVRENYERWQRLSPEERSTLHERLDRWQRLRPEEKQTLRQRQNEFRNLPPQERQRIRESLQREEFRSRQRHDPPRRRPSRP